MCVSSLIDTTTDWLNVVYNFPSIKQYWRVRHLTSTSTRNKECITTKHVFHVYVVSTPQDSPISSCDSPGTDDGWDRCHEMIPSISIHLNLIFPISYIHHFTLRCSNRPAAKLFTFCDQIIFSHQSFTFKTRVCIAHHCIFISFTS